MNTLTQNLTQIETEIKDFVLADNHPCIMANSIFKMGNYDLKVYESMGEKESLKQLLSDLERYLMQYDFEDRRFESFLAVFPNEHFQDELSFEKALWKTLQKLHLLDTRPWDPRVSDDVEDENFSFSLKGRAFYIIGMHPLSSRMARQAPYTTLVFNLHSQFEALREMGTYKKVRDTIRHNDEMLQGSVNPVLEDFGEDSECKQYSGRQVEQDWECPFHKK